jgi:uncharacterized protein (DUF302 family)
VSTTQVSVQRVTVISSKPFDEVVKRLDVGIGHPDMAAFRSQITSSKTYAELESIVQKVTATSGLMEFTRFDLGEILRKKHGEKARKSLRLVAGNPVIMAQMVEHVPDAGSYAPVTILIDERADGVHLTYDTMASYLASYGNAEALQVARDLDDKVSKLLHSAAG